MLTMQQKEQEKTKIFMEDCVKTRAAAYHYEDTPGFFLGNALDNKCGRSSGGFITAAMLCVSSLPLELEGPTWFT